MLPHLIKFELSFYTRKIWIYLSSLLFFAIGFTIGASTVFSFPNVHYNAPYTIYFVLSILSLISIVPIVLISAQTLNREIDSSFDQLLYTSLITKNILIGSRTIVIVSIATLLQVVLCIGLFTGHFINPQRIGGSFNFWPHAQSLVLFAVPNILITSSIILFTGIQSKNKLTIYLTGISLFLLYMVISIYSNSPLIANASPASAGAMKWAAVVDPFGISAFFEQTHHWANHERNNKLLSFSGNLMINRIVYLALSSFLFFKILERFSLKVPSKINTKDKTKKRSSARFNQKDLLNKLAIKPNGWKYKIQSIWALLVLDYQAITKGKSLWLFIIACFFFLSMNIYGTLDSGIRIPQHFATTSLVFNEILATLPFLLLLLILFFGSELVWKSSSFQFDHLQFSTPINNYAIIFSKILMLAFITSAIIILVIGTGILFQVSYSYHIIDWKLYSSLFYFLGLPALLCTSLVVCIQFASKNKFIGIAISLLVLISINTAIGKLLGLGHPLFRFAQFFNGDHSEINGLGYLKFPFLLNIFYSVGICGLVLILIVATFAYPGVRAHKFKLLKIPLLSFITITIFPAFIILENYNTSSRDEVLFQKQEYEQEFKVLKEQATPTITTVEAHIDLYPSENFYEVKGSYAIVNETNHQIDQLLINLNPTLEWKSISIDSSSQIEYSKDKLGVVHNLDKPISPKDTSQFQFEFTYKIPSLNGHDSFNAIINNGSFIRLSNYFPSFGYDSNNEIKDELERNKRKLGEQDKLRPLEAPIAEPYDYQFIKLKTNISTEDGQTVRSTGRLIKEYVEADRRFFQFEADEIPFRFACASGKYQQFESQENEIAIEIMVHPNHQENVDHLSQRIKKSLTYCQDNFGAYPHKNISFVEVSNFTEGFAATAYPGTIFMTERAFHVDLSSDDNQDVINQIAGHELAHQWWGTSQISPDYREGRNVLTESIAMYIELMLYKEQHGINKMEEMVDLYQELYNSQKGFSNNEILYKSDPENHNVVYNKGLIVMYKLYLLIGERKINDALRSLFQKHMYPNTPPTTLNLIDEILCFSPKSRHIEIVDLFKK